MPTNQQRREAAKRKLQRQLQRREAERARRRRSLVIASVAALALVAAGVVFVVLNNQKKEREAAAAARAAAAPCQYTDAPGKAKDVQKPAVGYPAKEGTVAAAFTLNGVAAELTLNRASAPCSVNAFISLASQGFYNDTSCWRLTNAPGLAILQCGDPSGKGDGGPGYTFPATPPTAPEGASPDASLYPVGTVAMANAAATEGSQFFIVAGPMTVQPDYSIIGTLNQAGMDEVKKIAAGGVTGGGQEGKPALPALINSITVPGDAAQSTGDWPTTPESTALASDLTDVPTDEPAGSDAPASDASASDAPASDAPATDSPASTVPASPAEASTAPATTNK